MLVSHLMTDASILYLNDYLLLFYLCGAIGEAKGRVGKQLFQRNRAFAPFQT